MLPLAQMQSVVVVQAEGPHGPGERGGGVPQGKEGGMGPQGKEEGEGRGVVSRRGRAGMGRREG